MLQSMESKRVGHDSATEHQQTNPQKVLKLLISGHPHAPTIVRTTSLEGKKKNPKRKKKSLEEIDKYTQ